MKKIIKILPKYRVSITPKINIPTKDNDVLPKKTKKRNKTHEDYVEELKIKNPNVIPIEKYINSSTKINHKCLIHNVIWGIKPNNALQGKGCNKCMREKISNKRKLSHNDYIEKVKIVNPFVEVLEQYINYDTPILHRYKECGHESKVSPASILQGSRCGICANKRIGEITRKTNPDYIKELSIKNPNLVALENYNGANTPILHEYKKCGHKAKITPASALCGYGCKICANKKTGDRCRKTHEDYVDEVKIKRPDIKVLGIYKNRNTPILHLHKNCGHRTLTAPSNILGGCGCSICNNINISKRFIKSHEQYLEDLENKNIPCRPVEPYINDRTKIKHVCPIHNIIFDSCPNNILSGRGCKQCGREKYSQARKKSQQKYIQELNQKNPNLTVLGKYIDANTHIVHSCKQKHKFNMTPSVALHGGLCPICNCTQSKGEKRIEDFLISYNISYLKQHKYKGLVGINNGLLSYDFYLPQYNLLIEFQGEQHETPIEHYGGIKKFIKQKIHDARKRKYCHENNINFLEIWYYEIHKTESILKQFINNLKSVTVTTTGVA